MILYMYIAPGQGLTTPWGRNFDVNSNILSLRSFVASLKKNLFDVWFYTIFFMILNMYIAPGQGQTAPQRTKFWCQQKCLVTSFICCKFQKKCLWSLILYNFFHDLIHVYSPGAGTDSPQGTKTWIFYAFVASLNEISLKYDFIHFFFHDLMHVYSPGAGGIQTTIVSEKSFVLPFSHTKAWDQIWPCRKIG